MKPTGFETAFDSLANVVEMAATIPDHRERPVETPDVVHTSDLAEVEVVVNDGKIRSIRVDPAWYPMADPHDVCDLIAATANAALEEWAAAQMQAIQQLTPDIQQLNAAIQQTRSQFQDAWVRTLAEVKVP